MVFFIGGFGYNIADSDTNPGLEPVAITLAFGMWWMNIPHLAVISNTLLASNNPSTLQGLVGRQFSNTSKPKNRAGQVTQWLKGEAHLDSVIDGVTKDAYDSTYKPVALWRRGRNKQDWMLRAIGEIEKRDGCPKESVEDIRKALVFGRKDWTFAIGLTVLLLSIPYVLAFSTSYLTPLQGLSCRSLTHTTFFVSQIVQILAWSLEPHLQARGANGKLDREPCQWTLRSNNRWVRKASRGISSGFRYTPSLLKALLWVFKQLSRLVAVFTAIGGTLLQVIGAYDNCVCLVSSHHFFLSRITNSNGSWILRSFRLTLEPSAPMTGRHLVLD